MSSCGEVYELAMDNHHSLQHIVSPPPHTHTKGDDRATETCDDRNIEHLHPFFIQREIP